MTLAALSGKRNVEVLRPSVRLSVPSFFSNFNRAHGAYSTWFTRGQQATWPVYISVWVLGGRKY